MTHESADPHGEGTIGYSQGIFLGWLAVGLLALMVVVPLIVIAAGASYGFQ